jgi:hypothetical protein
MTTTMRDGLCFAHSRAVRPLPTNRFTLEPMEYAKRESKNVRIRRDLLAPDEKTIDELEGPSMMRRRQDRRQNRLEQDYRRTDGSPADKSATAATRHRHLFLSCPRPPSQPTCFSMAEEDFEIRK